MKRTISTTICVLSCVAMMVHSAIGQAPTKVYGPVMNNQKWTTRTNGQYPQGALGYSTTILRVGQWLPYLLQAHMGWTFSQATLPPEATITKAKLRFQAFTGGPDRTFDLYDTHLSLLTATAYDLYATMNDAHKILRGTTTTLNGEHIFVDSSAALQQAVQAALSSGRNYLTLSVKHYSENDTYNWDITNGSDVSTVTLQVWFSAPQYSVTFRNDLDGSSQGNITVNGSELSSGTVRSFYWGDQVAVQAYTGKYSSAGYSYKFHGWDDQFQNAQNPSSYTVLNNEDVVAFFTPVFTITVANNLDGVASGRLIYQNVEHTSSFTEQDIFRDQTRSFSAISPQTDGGATWTFNRWNDGTTNVSKSISTAATTTYTAYLKGNLKSSQASASSSNSQRKICYVPGIYHMVYESVGEVWYCNSSDGVTWSTEVRLSDGSGLNRQPSIAGDPKTGAFPYVAVVWEKYDAANAISTIYISRQTGSNQWESPQQVDYSSGVTPGFAGASPVLTLEPDIETVAWAMSCNGQFVGSPGIHVWYHDIMNDYTDMDILGGTDGSSQFPSICEHPYINTNGVIGIAWAHGGEIKYTRATYDFDRQLVQYSSCETVSSGSSLEDHAKPSLTIERYSSSWRPVVAWQAYNDITGYTAILQRRRESGGWGTITQYAKADDFSSPSIVPYESSVNLSMTWFEPDNEALHLAKYTGSWGSRIDLSASGRCPTLGYDGSGTNTHFRTLYTSGANAPYSLGTTNQSLPKSGSANSEVVMRSVTAIADGIARTFTVKAIALSSDGAKTPIAFVDAPDSLVAESAEDAAGFLATEPVTIPQGATLIVDWESSCALKDSKALSTGSQVIGTLELSDASTGKALSKTTLDTVASDLGTLKTRSVRYGIGGLASKKVIARFYPKATGKNAASWSLCTIHYDSSKAANGLVKQSSEDIVAAIPTAFDLSANYPNPFNPSTQVGFALPKDAVVSLMVYDVLGREIAQLARGAYSAGYHSLRWDASSHASGVYYARLSVSDDFGNLLFTKTSKMLLAK